MPRMPSMVIVFAWEESCDNTELGLMRMGQNRSWMPSLMAPNGADMWDVYGGSGRIPLISYVKEVPELFAHGNLDIFQRASYGACDGFSPHFAAFFGLFLSELSPSSQRILESSMANREEKDSLGSFTPR